MKNLYKILAIITIIFSLGLAACEEVVPEGRILFDNYESCTFSCYFDGEYLGTVEPYGEATFTVEATCGTAEIKSSACGDDDLYVCVSEGETEVVEIQ